MATKVLTWGDVCDIHKTMCGVSIHQGRVVSVLVSDKRDDPYQNLISDDLIRYHVRQERSGVEWATALKALVGTPDHVRVFRKLGVNRWEDRGEHLVAQVEELGEDCFFTLKPVTVQL